MKFLAEQKQKIRDLLRQNGVSYHTLTMLRKDENSVFANGICKKLCDYVDVGEIVEISLPQKAFVPVPKKDLGVKILYQDEQIIVIFKPKGVASTPTKAHFENSISSNLNLIFGDDFVTRVVTRLDKDTSGLMLLAKNCIVQWNIQKDFSQVSRIYVAVVQGILQNDGTIRAKIAKSADSMKRIVDENGKDAVTHYKVLGYENGNSIVQCILETGRTHQIRVHMAHIGHPILGDKLYGENNLTYQACNDLQKNSVQNDLPLHLECVQLGVFGKTFVLDNCYRQINLDKTQAKRYNE